MRDGPMPWLAYPFGWVKGVLGWFLARLFSRTLILASVQEDLPYGDNRITLGEEGEPVLEYRVRPEEKARITLFRDKLKALLSPYRFLVFKEAQNNERIAHVCGTCRFGDDPGTSVLDRNNKAHELDNLYVVDSSFFPSSGGTNPALTIAANALRVAEHLKGKTTHE
jgi:choline dehydrogenase-like flavoprotein